jgi:hypothetical protein
MIFVHIIPGAKLITAINFCSVCVHILSGFSFHFSGNWEVKKFPHGLILLDWLLEYRNIRKCTEGYIVILLVDLFT